MRVLIIGGAGVFGHRMARLLDAHRPDTEIILAGRDGEKARAAAAALTRPAEHVALDRDGDLDSPFATFKPDVVVDSAGPFQAYGERPYRVAEAALAAGAHYLDLSDDAAFTTGVSALDEAAKDAGRVALSGVSSTPTLSAAAARTMAAPLSEIALIDTAILPGNRAPRGLSVMRAILSQVGKPLAEWRGGEWRDGIAWGETRRIETAALGRRRVSPIGAPERVMFPKLFKSRSARFAAGLELAVLHQGLRLAALPVRFGLVRSLEPFARAFRQIAGWFEPFGSDRGGMVVRVGGRDAGEAALEREWRLTVGSGDGPSTPAIPAFALLERLGELTPGARPCLEEAPLAAFEAALRLLDAQIAVEERPAPRLFEHAMGPETWAAAPAPVRRLHDIWDLERFEGEAEVERGKGVLPNLVAAIMGLPRAAPAVPVVVEIERRDDKEIWRRRFGGRLFRSVLSTGPKGCVRERIGPLSAEISFALEEDRLVWTVARARILGVPLPKALTPGGCFYETQDDNGRFCFHVDIEAPLVGRVARYRGWLQPKAEQGLTRRKKPC